jgi:tellurium resistance protein TerD
MGGEIFSSHSKPQNERNNTMPVSLVKGQNVSLTKEAGNAGLSKITVGLGWDVRATDGDAFDLDASAFLLGESGKVVDAEKGMIFFNNLNHGGVTLTGDNRTGQGDGDDEQIKIDLNAVDASVKTIAIAVTIYDGANRNQNFGMVTKSFCRVVNDADGTELARLDLQEDASTERAMIMGEIYRNGSEWKFRATGQGYEDQAKLARNYGINV